MSRMDVPPIPNRGRISARLEKALGLGTQPELRRALYQKLEQLVNGDQGSDVLDCIDAVVSDASDKADPGKYFAFVVTRRLMERGLMERKRVDW